MSIRTLGTRLFRHGQTYVRHICRRDYNINIAEKVGGIEQAAAKSGQLSNSGAVPRNFALRNVGLQFSVHARRIFIDNVLNRVTNSLASELRRKAARRILFGDSGPFFALVGVSLASGTGILTKEEELEGVCWEIREAISKFKWNVDKEGDVDEATFRNESISLNNLSLGNAIAKGSSAVVYAASLKSTATDHAIVKESRGSEAIINEPNSDESFAKYPLAVKMMFNYDIQSNAMAILRAMYRETVPAQQCSNKTSVNWEIELSKRTIQLPSHPNVVAMYSVFADRIPELPDARKLYPAALPASIYPDGEGRNMSLFLVMKRYNCSLQQYLSSTEPSLRISILLLAQLLEGISHLNLHGVAHRDLKSDNLLLDTLDVDIPILVISDFGCCLADKNKGLLLNYSSYEIDKGGNIALMAPEILSQTPGILSVLNYSKADLWAAGSIAYEIFGAQNPFYDGKGWKKLMSTEYKEEELPELPEGVPNVIKGLVRNILRRNPNKRLDPEVAANVCQLFLWAPSTWLKSESTKLPSNAEILQWLLCMATKVLCEGRLHNQLNSSSEAFAVISNKAGRRTYPEYLLIASFLRRAKLSTIRAALTWIHNNN